jgi:5-methylcytosine-specific restriction endonuclease McrA
MDMTVTCNTGGFPLGLVSMQEAVSALASEHIGPRREHGCYALISDEERLFRSTSGLAIPAPLVMATTYAGGYADVSHENRRPTRRVLFARDRYTCQYCGHIADAATAYRVLTVDHVKPQHLFSSREGANSWENLTTACQPCNARKGGHLPMEVRGRDGRPMLPRSTPRRPDFVQVRFAGRLHPAQRDYLNQFTSSPLLGI